MFLFWIPCWLPAAAPLTPLADQKRGAKHIKFIGLIAAPEGLKALHEAHPDVDIYVAAQDEKLNENGTSSPAWAMQATASSAPSNISP